MNILLTSVGRRSYLVHYFKEVISGKVIAANTSAETAAMYVADHAEIVPSSSDENYINVIIEICKKH